jgi:MFS transporter, DHA1 family, multidrug resistance protein
MTDSRNRDTPWGLILILGALTAFGPMSIDMYLPSLPAIAQDLHSDMRAAQATVSVFFAGLAVGQLFYGPASDRFGRRRPLLIGVSLYIAASIACALAGSMPMLTAGRLVQALGGCAGLVIARAVVRDRFDHQDTARIFSWLTLVMGLAPILAPLLGGLVLQVASWRWIFAALAMFGVVVGAAIVLRLSESRSAATEAQARSEHPVSAYLSLLKKRRLIGYLLAGCLNGAGLLTYVSSSPALLMGTYGVTPDRFGWFFGVNAVGIIGGSQLNRLLLKRMTFDQVLRVFSLAATGFSALLALAAFTGFGGMWGVLVPLFMVLSSYGVMSANTAAGALSVDPPRAGSTSALIGAASFGFGALASAAAAGWHDGSARPLATVFVICMTASAACLRLLALPRTQGSGV